MWNPFRKKITETKHRVQLDFAEEAYKRLQHLQANANKTAAEVIGTSLSLYEWYLGVISAGGTILVKKADGTVERIRFV